MKRFKTALRGASWFATTMILVTGLARPAFAFYSTDNVFWDHFTTQCNSCEPTITSVTAWPYPAPLYGQPELIGVVQTDPACSNERWAQTSSYGGDNNGSNYIVKFTMNFQDVDFCSNFVPFPPHWAAFPVNWRVEWSHQ
jgi:hypothetical protein